MTSAPPASSASAAQPARSGRSSEKGHHADPDRLEKLLRKAGISHVGVAARRRAEYATDASNYRVVPSAVVFPHSADDVLAALAVCRAEGVPLTSRGAGTSIAGNSIGSGVVLDFSRHMNRILELDPYAHSAVVEPGVILDAITDAAAPHGLRFGPDPSTHARATIGGTLGNNACGSRALAYGRSSDNILDLDLLTANGSRFTAGRYGRDGLTAAMGAPAKLMRDLDGIVANNLGLIRTEFGRFTRQVSGYSMEALLPEHGVDLARFLVGTEGTLGVILQAKVRLVTAPKATALVVLGYADMAAAADAVMGILPHKPVALEGMDARLVEVVRSRRGEAAVPDLPKGGGWLFVETSGETEAEAKANGMRLVTDAHCLDSAIVTGATARALWRIREDGAGLGGRTPSNQPAWPGWEDSAVPPHRLGRYLREFTELMRDHDVDALVYGHFGDGCIHSRIDFPLVDHPRRFRAFMLDAAQLVARHGGSMSGEHGDGRARGELLQYMYSPGALATFAAVKHAFDPDDVLNPGIIVAPEPLDANLRVPAAKPLRKHLAFAYPHDGGDITTAVHRCVGVGKCRADTTASGGVMCPSYLATKDEKDSTRARARVLQELANTSADHLLKKGWRSPEIEQSLDLCLSCKGCSADCPAGVDMATYKSEALHQRYRHRLRPASHYALGQLPRWAKLASHAPRLVNALMGRKSMAALGKRMAGVDQRRPLPEFAPTTFRAWFAARPEADRAKSLRPAKSEHAAKHHSKVALWVDTFTNHFSPEVGIAAVEVLEDAGYEVELTRADVCCGLTWISTGQLDGARKQLRRSLDALAPMLADGTPIVGLEPSCTAVLRSDVTELLADDPRSAKVAGLTRTLAEVLNATDGWKPPSLRDVQGVAQPHCHQHAVMGWSEDAKLLADAGAVIEPVGGCCGLAGNFGVERGHYEVSVAVAENALLPAVRAAAPDAVVLADGFSCRTQLEQLAEPRSQGQHLAQLLAGALHDRHRREEHLHPAGSAEPAAHPGAHSANLEPTVSADLEATADENASTTEPSIETAERAGDTA